MQSVSIDSLPNNQIINIENQFATARISLFGAHVISFVPKKDNRERLWLSPQASLEGNEAIRGGTPICWPWFSNQFPEKTANLPSHGFVRSNLWTLSELNTLASGETEIKLTFQCDGKPGFPFSATILFTVVVGENLSMSLTTRNTDSRPFSITAALHSYFKVGNLENVKLSGLSGRYRDKTKNFAHQETPENYVFAGEVDRIHETLNENITIHDSECQTRIANKGHDSLVIWNPGKELVRTISNIPNDGYTQFVCVEAAITTATEILPGKAHTLSQSVL